METLGTSLDFVRRIRRSLVDFRHNGPEILSKEFGPKPLLQTIPGNPLANL